MAPGLRHSSCVQGVVWGRWHCQCWLGLRGPPVSHWTLEPPGPFCHSWGLWLRRLDLGSAHLEVRVAGLGAQASLRTPSGCHWLLCLLRGVGEVQHHLRLPVPAGCCPCTPVWPLLLPPPMGHAHPRGPPHLTALVLAPTPLDQPLPWAVLQAEGRQAGHEGRPALGWIQVLLLLFSEGGQIHTFYFHSPNDCSLSVQP